VSSPRQTKNKKKFVNRTHKTDRLHIMIIHKAPTPPRRWEYQRDVRPAEGAVCEAVGSPIVEPHLGAVIGRCVV
jgi:hypothetical protein